MLICDCAVMAGTQNPITGTGDESRWGARFVAMSDAWNKDLRALALDVAATTGYGAMVSQVCTLARCACGGACADDARQGVYVQTAGPSFETAAECNFMRSMGGGAVGMSTVPEVVVARQMGARVLGLSLITNACVASTEDAPASHEEVLAAGDAGSRMMLALVSGIVARVPPLAE